MGPLRAFSYLVRALLTTVAACAALLAVPGTAAAAKDMGVSIMDDQLLLDEANPFEVDRHMRRFRALGIDRLRVSAFWDQIAPRPGARRKPSFDATDSGTGTRYDFTNLDRVVLRAVRNDLDVLISITTPAPRWATGEPRRKDRTWKPKPREFAMFAGAVAKRYGHLVDQFAVLNEPNQPGWLKPQTDKRGPYAPHHYRRLVRAAFPEIRGGAPDATILVGELASSGSLRRGPRSAIRPLAFLREFGCVKRSFRHKRSGRCRNFKPARADVIGHHPYQFFAHPARRSRHRDDAAIGDGRRLIRFLDRLVRARGLVSARGGKLDVHYTEFGYQTDPPDPYAGIPLRRHARWLQEAAYVAWRTPRVRSLNQFRLTDGRIARSQGLAGYNEFQSGLLFRNGRAKPAYRFFDRPFVAVRRGKRVRFWGQVRTGGRHRVQLQRKRGRRWKTVARTRTTAAGYWQRRLPLRAGTYRFRWPRGKSQKLRVT